MRFRQPESKSAVLDGLELGAENRLANVVPTMMTPARRSALSHMNQERSGVPLRIGELANEFDLNPKTIRYYEHIGLLPAPQRSTAGYRLYGNVDRERLHFITKAKAIGLTLQEIGAILALKGGGTEPCPHVQGHIEPKFAAVDEQLRLAVWRGSSAAGWKTA